MNEKSGKKKANRKSRSAAGGEGDVHDATWNGWLAQLKAFKKKHGHCNVPAKFSQNPSLASWVSNQRNRNKKGQIKPERVRKLDEIGFEWVLRIRSVWRHDWDAMVADLTNFKDRFGHCNVPDNWPENETLAIWIRRVCRSKRAGLLTRERVQQLNELGVVWAPRRQKWKDGFAALKKFKRRFGHCAVPKNWEEDPQLANWVSSQRLRWRANRLPQEDFEKLDRVGFVWKFSKREQWETRYNELIEYQRVHGTCHISTLSEGHRALGNWIRTQRTKRKAGRLTREQLRKLKEIDFVWDVVESRWEDMYIAMGRYKEVHGHCHVPSGWLEDQPLANWVQTQRANYEKGRLPQSKIRRLNKLGFIWDGKKARERLLKDEASRAC